VHNGYFDYNATTPLSPGVSRAICESLHIYGNPSAKYTSARKAKLIVDDARQSLADLLGCGSDRIVFTSGGTESNTLAIQSILSIIENNKLSQHHVITSAIEHPSILQTLQWYQQRYGLQLSLIKPGADGRVSEEDFLAAIRPETCLMSVMAVNNETGVIQPFNEISRIGKNLGIPCHIDAVQAVGKIPLICSATDASTISFSGHKFYGPKGIGGLYYHPSHKLLAMLHGGGQEMSLRSGTENTLGLAGIAKAARECHVEIPQNMVKFSSLREYAIRKLSECNISFTCNGSNDLKHQAQWTLNLSIKGIRAEALSARLDLCHGIAISLGSACSNNKNLQRSHVLLAMGLQPEEVDSAVRISFGRYTTKENIDRLVQAIEQETAYLKGMASNVPGGDAYEDR
jgi:cysteine desulfurase